MDEFAVVVFEQCAEGGLEAQWIAELLGMVPGEAQGFQGVIKAHDADPFRDPGQVPQGGGDIGRAAQPHIPEHPFRVGRSAEAFGESQLSHVQRLGLGDRADDRVEGFPFGQGSYAGGAVGQLDQGVSEFHRWRGEAQRSAGSSARAAPGITGQSVEASSSELEPFQRPGSAHRPRVDAATKAINS